MKVSIGSDHAGVSLKSKAVAWLETNGYTVTDHGPFSEDSVDYPDFGHPVASDVESNTSELGVVICGSGNGINMTVNKHQGIRGALCWNTELAALARQHNNANVLSLPARFVDEEEGIKILAAFFNASFEGGRHDRRVQKIRCS